MTILNSSGCSRDGVSVHNTATWALTTATSTLPFATSCISQTLISAAFTSLSHSRRDTGTYVLPRIEIVTHGGSNTCFGWIDRVTRALKQTNEAYE